MRRRHSIHQTSHWCHRKHPTGRHPDIVQPHLFEASPWFLRPILCRANDVVEHERDQLAHLTNDELDPWVAIEDPGGEKTKNAQTYLRMLAPVGGT